MLLKPKVFVGSSSEGKDVAEAFCRILSDVASMIPWWLVSEFQAGGLTLSALRTAAENYDFGLFILTSDDELESRGIQMRSARDNVLFEFGLFLGTLGPERAVAVIEETTNEATRPSTNKRAKFQVEYPVASLSIHSVVSPQVMPPP